jgi:hypothetical protein
MGLNYYFVIKPMGLISSKYVIIKLHHLFFRLEKSKSDNQLPRQVQPAQGHQLDPRAAQQQQQAEHHPGEREELPTRRQPDRQSPYPQQLFLLTFHVQQQQAARRSQRECEQ